MALAATGSRRKRYLPSATGHYVNKQKIDGYWYITCGNDADKDQSFFLWGLPQSILERMCLPMGGLTKTRVREIAAARGFLKAAKKRDSLGVCFCPMDYRTFLKAHVPEGEIIPGNFYDEQGQKIGKHEGYPFYTIGQRRGLGIHLNKALFVKEIIPPENKIIISDNLQALEKKRNVSHTLEPYQSRCSAWTRRCHCQNTLPETSQPMHCHLTGRPATAYTTA